MLSSDSNKPNSENQQSAVTQSKKIKKLSNNVQKYYDYQEELFSRLEDQDEVRRSPDNHRENYITVNRFYVEIESEVRASFTECAGLGVNLKKETYLEGGVNDQQRIILGHAEFTDVTLKRGMTDDLAFWGWISYTLTGKPNRRRNVNILLFNQAGETMMCWTLIGATPISWKAPGFQADGNSVAIEELTLAYEGLQVRIKEEGSGGATVGLSRDVLGLFPSN